MDGTTQSAASGDPNVGFVLLLLAFFGAAALAGSSTSAENPRHKKWREANDKEQWRYGWVVFALFASSMVSSYLSSLHISLQYPKFFDGLSWFSKSLWTLVVAIGLFAAFRWTFRGSLLLKTLTVYIPLAVWSALIIAGSLRAIPLPSIVNWIVGGIAGIASLIPSTRWFPLHEKQWKALGLATNDEPYPPTPIYHFGFYNRNSKENNERRQNKR